MYRFLLLAAPALIALAAPAASAQSSRAIPGFVVEPGTTVLSGEPLTILLTGLSASGPVTIAAERLIYSSFHGGDRLLFRSEATFAAPLDGTLDLGAAVPVRGSYSGADVRGLFWSMTPTRDSIPAEARPNRVRLRARSGGRLIADTVIVFQNSRAGVRVDSVPGFPGALFSSIPGGGRRPVIIVLGGAEGGAGAARSEGARLASQGFAVLGLPYYSPSATPGGPREIPQLPADFADIPIERLTRAYAWLGTRDDVDTSRVALYGGSKGSEMALLAACHFAWVDAVVAVAPSDVVWEGWGWEIQPGTRSSFALDGRPFPFVPYEGMVEIFERYGRGERVRLREYHDRGRAAHPDAIDRARIPVERFRGSLLVVAGEDDQLWDSARMARAIAERRRAAGLETTALIYAGAGHILNGNGWSPTTHYNDGLQQYGGEPAATARAQAEVWPATLAFLRQALR